MTEARNVYPRLCWGCLAVIESYAADYANLNYGGLCHVCDESNASTLPGLELALDRYGQMNDISEREELLRQTRALEYVRFNCNCGESLSITKYAPTSLLSGVFCQNCDQQWYVRWRDGVVRKGPIVDEEATQHTPVSQPIDTNPQ